MNFKTNIGLVILFAFTSCNFGIKVLKKVKNKMDLLTYENKIFEAKDTDSKNIKNPNIHSIRIQYPLFDNQPDLNFAIKNRIFGFFPDTTSTDTSFKQIANDFFNQIKSGLDKEGFKNKIDSISMYVEVLNQDSSLVTIRFKGILTGFYNKLTASSFINWDTKQKSELKLYDLFKDGYQIDLQHIGEYIFLDKDPNFLSHDYNYKYYHDKKFYLTDNFVITPNGLKFIYNEEELKPKNFGAVELLIPYNEIKSIIKLNTVLAQYYDDGYF